ncbi:MAG: beta-galactosidase [Solobacterium sp.]|nr:beta-galactosidase [Solobacterium sp.]
MNQIIYGCAYYDEYMPFDRLDKDIEMMKKAGINMVRIAESTWSTEQPDQDTFDFTSVIRVMDAMEEAGIDVIIGTPTYAVPYWLVHQHPEIMADTDHGPAMYGARQLMDISSPAYREAAERIIRQLLEVTANRKCVIGYQIDNETKYYDAVNEGIQKAFVRHLRERFHDDIQAMNKAFGLAYWSNALSDWDVFPDIRGSINGSLKGEFDKFRRTLVDDFLAWQADIVRQYKRDDQFITHNFDYEWRGYSFGVQPRVNHFHAAKCLTLTGCDIYHPTQDRLTGAEIAFGGDMARSLKHDNYLVLETQAHGFPDWLPFDGQLLQQAYSHFASGANGISYWHWHSIHNSAETYWMGILTHDFRENSVYDAVCEISSELRRIGPHLVNLKKKNRTAVLVSNEALTALNSFPMDMNASFSAHTFYNDIVRWVYDALYRMNNECDFISPEADSLSDYDMIVIPALYDADEEILNRLDRFAKEGGTILATFKTAYANEDTKVYPDVKPHILHQAFGMSYNEFTFPVNTGLKNALGNVGKAEVFMELIKPDTAETLVCYDHPSWGKYSAATVNAYGKGHAYYIGTKCSDELLESIIHQAAESAGIETEGHFPLIIRKGINDFGQKIMYFFNYSQGTITARAPAFETVELRRNRDIAAGQDLILEPWSVMVLEEK